MQEKTVKIAEWIATACIIIGSISLSGGFPLISAVFFCVGSIIWAMVGLSWCKHSLAVTNIFIVVVYIAGFIGIADYIKTLF